MSTRLMNMPSINVPNPFPLSEMQLRFTRIKSNWWPFFQQAATITRLPVELLAAKSAVESGGNQVTRNQTYVGLMQVGQATIQDALNFLCGEMYADGKKWAAPLWMTRAAMPLIEKYLPGFDPKSVKSFSAFAAFTAAKKYGEFNVLMGAIYLYALLINPKFQENGVVRLDKVMSGYNTGPNLSIYSPRNRTLTADTSSLINLIRSSTGLSAGKKKETTAHILKFTGTNGALDLVFNRKILDQV